MLVIYYIYSGVYIYVNPQLPIPPPTITTIWEPSPWLLCTCVFDVLWGRQFNLLKSYFSVFAFVAYVFGVTYIKPLLRPMFTTSPGCFLLAHL